MRSASSVLVQAIAAMLLAASASGCSLFGGSARSTTSAATSSSVGTREQAAPAVSADLLARYSQAIAAMKASDWNSAETLLFTLTQANPDLPGPAVNLAIVYRVQKRPDEARKLLEATATRWPAFAPAQHQLGLQLRDAGQFEAADAAFAKAQAASPDYALAWYDRAVLNELYLQRLPAALENYEQFQKLQPAEDEQVARWIKDLRRRTNKAPAVARPDTTGKPS